jgi:hypothetical protein
MRDTRQPQHEGGDSRAFWLAVAAALIVLGGVAISVASFAVYDRTSVWESGWFIAGIVIAGLGTLTLLRAMALHLARHSPSPAQVPGGVRGHEYLAPGPPSAAGRNDLNNALPLMDKAWMRSILREEIRPELQDSLNQMVKAQQDGRYWQSASGPLPDYTWNRNRHRLSGFPNIGFLYDDLEVAFGHVKRINTLRVDRANDADLVLGEDDLAAAATAIRGAIKTVERQLYELG